jgi:hypothetical protein
VIAVAVRWYLRYGLSYRDVEELLAERGIDVDHVTIYRWVQTFTAEFIDAARRRGTPAAIGGSWTKPTSRSPAGGPSCIVRSTSTGRSSASWSPTVAMPVLRGRSSPAHSLPALPRPRSARTGRRSSRV